jgi:DNA polymerase type B, organellar and viral
MSELIFDLDSLLHDVEGSDWTTGRAPGHTRRKRYEDKRTSRPNRKGGHRTTLLEKPICALDGEGKSAPNGRHDYCLIVAVWPTGRAHKAAKHLTTEQCFEFILNLPDDHVYLGYGLSYDTNMWLRDMPNEHVDRLLETGKLRYRQFSIEWVERKYMTIRAYGKTRTVYDVLAFFQVPFVSPNPSLVKGACDAWLPECADEFEFVRFMKDLRGQFAGVPDEQIERYTYIECELLGKLMRKFIDALKACDVRPNALYGPGAVAAAYLQAMRVKSFMAPLDEPLATLARTSYFGGRFDAAMFGWLTNVYQNDIKSAYPSIARYLPCLAHAAWEHLSGHVDYRLIAQHGMYHVVWNVPPESHWGPFPHRTSTGLIYYPYDGAGWYHADEVKAAIEWYGEDAINVTEGWALTPACDHRPFAFIDSLYALRKQLESAGNYDQGIVIKLILNSLYGKLAQQVGARKDQAPPFQCFFWAGAITAGTRAEILRAISMSPDKVISIATDGIVVTEELDLEYGEELGEWDVKKLSAFAQISNGVYHAVDEKGKHIDRARGLGRGVLNFDKGGALYRQWKATKGCGIFAYKGRTRFITLREASHSAERDDIKCRWLDEYRTLKLAPARRFPWVDADMRKRDIMHTRLLGYAEESNFTGQLESQPFRVKTKRGETEAARDAYQGTSWLDAA